MQKQFITEDRQDTTLFAVPVAMLILGVALLGAIAAVLVLPGVLFLSAIWHLGRTRIEPKSKQGQIEITSIARAES